MITFEDGVGTIIIGHERLCIVMIRAFTAFTKEIDDEEIAVNEILEQLDLSKLAKNSIGILTCYSEFIDTGVVSSLCAKLPFDVIGCTTMGNSTNGSAGHLDLTLMVLTGDDVGFSAAVSPPVSDNQEESLSNMYLTAANKLQCSPKFIIAFMPLIYDIGGEMLLDILDRLSNLPVFGTMAVDHTKDYHVSRTIFNGEIYPDSLSIVLVGGDISPKFTVASLSEEKILKQRAIITASEKNILKEVNGLPVVQYMESLGLTVDGQIIGPSTLPFVVDFNDGTKPVIRAIFAQTPEGYAVCGGAMPVNSTLSIGSLDYNDVMETTQKIVKTILEENNRQAVIIFSCVGRNYALGVRTIDEMLKIDEALKNKLKYQLAYSGGEICPLYNVGGEFKNRFHNDTIIACIL